MGGGRMVRKVAEQRFRSSVEWKRAGEASGGRWQSNGKSWRRLGPAMLDVKKHYKFESYRIASHFPIRLKNKYTYMYNYI